jgi:nitrate/TMAO reductase-like tetraheme cytochrome c subunit
MKGVRLLLGVLLLFVTGWVLLAIFAPEEAPAEPMQFTSSTECRSCHEQVYAEWENSWHSKAWVDPDVLSLSDNFSNTDCIDCHAPRPVFSTGIGKRVLPRSSRRSEGVDCIACHALPGGGVAGTIENPSAPCGPRAKVELQRPEFCGVCHDQHKTVQQWKASRYPAMGIGCIDCHMPFRDGDPNLGRDHTSHGAHDVERLRRAVELRGVREEGRWTIEVENVGAGHSFPTDERSRAADLFWRPLVTEGAEKPAWKRFYRFRSPYRYEVGIVDNLLEAGENRRIPLEAEGSEGKLEVALFYKLTPYFTDPENPDPDTEAILVHTVELVP